MLHAIRVRVYFEDTDAGGIVYYANYLKYFERARSDWLRSLGVDHRELARAHRCLVVRDCAVEYLRPARLDDLLDVDLAVRVPQADVRRASIRFAQRACDAATGAVLVTGTVRIACMDLRTGRPAGLPGDLADHLSTAALHGRPNLTTEGIAEHP